LRENKTLPLFERETSGWKGEEKCLKRMKIDRVWGKERFLLRNTIFFICEIRKGRMLKSVQS
jgi:hypothetical protein